MAIRPLRNNVLIKPNAEPQSASGLILSTTVSNEGTIVAVGPLVAELHVGDKVRFDKSSTVNMEGLLYCREADVLCVIE